MLQGLKKVNDAAWRMGEIPSSNFHASARGLGKLAGCMANGGRFKGKVLLSEEGYEALHAEATAEKEPVFDNHNLFT